MTNLEREANSHRWTRRALLAATAACALAQQRTSHLIRVLLVTGGHGHEPSFYSMFDALPGAAVNVEPHPAAFRTDASRRYDVAVLYDMMQIEEVDEPRRRNLQKFVESGKGLVILHHALCSYNSWEWWWREVAGARYLEKPEGTQTASTYKHDEHVRIRPALKHPVVDGIDPFEMIDETYKHMWMSPGNTVLLTTESPTSDGPVAWVSPYAKSRVVAIQPGHGRGAHQHPAFRRLVKNAILWSGTA